MTQISQNATQGWMSLPSRVVGGVVHDAMCFAVVGAVGAVTATVAMESAKVAMPYMLDAMGQSALAWTLRQSQSSWVSCEKSLYSIAASAATASFWSNMQAGAVFGALSGLFRSKTETKTKEHTVEDKLQTAVRYASGSAVIPVVQAVQTAGVPVAEKLVTMTSAAVQTGSLTRHGIFSSLATMPREIAPVLKTATSGLIQNLKEISASPSVRNAAFTFALGYAVVEISPFLLNAGMRVASWFQKQARGQSVSPVVDSGEELVQHTPTV